MNIHDLDGPLQFGNPKQISVVQALESGKRICSKPGCGTIIRADIYEEFCGLCHPCFLAEHGDDE